MIWLRNCMWDNLKELLSSLGYKTAPGQSPGDIEPGDNNQVQTDMLDCYTAVMLLRLVTGTSLLKCDLRLSTYVGCRRFEEDNRRGTQLVVEDCSLPLETEEEDAEADTVHGSFPYYS